MKTEKIIAIHQPNFFPWLGYFYKIANCDTFVILDNVEFQQGNHNSITNRTKIKCQGEEKFLTVSVKKNKESKIIKDIAIDKKATNISKLLKTIQYNYTKAAYFKEVFPLLEQILTDFAAYETMSEGNTFIIKSVCHLLKIETPMVKASEIDLITEDRNERIIEICKKLEGSVYFSGNGGKKYHDESLFVSNLIKIKYTDFKPKEYSQVGNPFLPGMSVIDVLLNCGVENTISQLKT